MKKKHSAETIRLRLTLVFFNNIAKHNILKIKYIIFLLIPFVVIVAQNLKKIELRNIKKNDLIFWRGHVAVVISKNKLIHAYGPFKKVVIMPIKKTINRIYKTANLKIIGIRRIC